MWRTTELVSGELADVGAVEKNSLEHWHDINPCVVAACRPPIPPLGCLFSFFLFGTTRAQTGTHTGSPPEAVEKNYIPPYARARELSARDGRGLHHMRGYMSTGKWPRAHPTHPAPRSRCFLAHPRLSRSFPCFSTAHPLIDSSFPKLRGKIINSQFSGL